MQWNIFRRKNEGLTPATTWMNLKNIMLGGRTSHERPHFYKIFRIGKLWRKIGGYQERRGMGTICSMGSGRGGAEGPGMEIQQHNRVHLQTGETGPGDRWRTVELPGAQAAKGERGDRGPKGARAALLGFCVQGQLAFLNGEYHVALPLEVPPATWDSCRVP